VLLIPRQKATGKGWSKSSAPVMACGKMKKSIITVIALRMAGCIDEKFEQSLMAITLFEAERHIITCHSLSDHEE